MKTKSYHKFWQRIHHSAREKSFPLRVMFELTYKCNFSCRHCYVPQSYRKRKGELKTQEVFSILGQLKDIGCFYLGFTGGEPFLRKDILQILRYAKRKGFETILYTNGSLINEKIANELGVLKPNKVDITIPAMSKNSFERITQVSGSQSKVFRAIDFLHKRRVNLGFKTCVLKENESEIKEIQDFAHLLGAQHRLDDMLFRRLDGSEEPYEYRGVLREDFVARPTLHAPRCTPRASRLIDCSSRNRTPLTTNRKLHTANLFECGAGMSQVAITPFGELKMCLMIGYPKFRILPDTSHAARHTPHVTRPQNSLKDTWGRLKELTASIKPDENCKCDNCELKPYCKWCPAKSWLYNRSFTSCEPESCKRAESIKQLLNC